MVGLAVAAVVLAVARLAGDGFEDTRFGGVPGRAADCWDSMGWPACCCTCCGWLAGAGRLGSALAPEVTPFAGAVVVGPAALIGDAAAGRTG